MGTIVTTDGTDIFYKDWGSGQPVVFSHGWPLNADAWDDQAMLVASNGYRAIAHDRRGHGRSSQPWQGNDLDTYADDLAQLINTLGLVNVVLVGHSTGGGEVTRFADRHVDQSPTADPVSREAYAREVISFGFWFGDDRLGEPAFYAYTAPEPPGLAEEPLQPAAAWWDPRDGSHLAVLRYDDARATSAPALPCWTSMRVPIRPGPGWPALAGSPTHTFADTKTCRASSHTSDNATQGSFGCPMNWASEAGTRTARHLLLWSGSSKDEPLPRIRGARMDQTRWPS